MTNIKKENIRIITEKEMEKMNLVEKAYYRIEQGYRKEYLVDDYDFRNNNSLKVIVEDELDVDDEIEYILEYREVDLTAEDIYFISEEWRFEALCNVQYKAYRCLKEYEGTDIEDELYYKLQELSEDASSLEDMLLFYLDARVDNLEEFYDEIRECLL